MNVNTNLCFILWLWSYSSFNNCNRYLMQHCTYLDFFRVDYQCFHGKIYTDRAAMTLDKRSLLETLHNACLPDSWIAD